MAGTGSAQQPERDPHAAEHAPVHPGRGRPATKLETAADQLVEDGATARDRADEYVLTTVFFASVLFFAGISLRITRPVLRMVILGLGVAFLGYGVVQIFLLPTLL